MSVWTKTNVVVICAVQIVLLILFCVFTRYDEDNTTAKYPIFQDVHVMIFIGFGFLMTFLKRYGFSSVGYNFLLASLMIQWVIIMEGIFEMTDGKIKVQLQSLIGADVGAAAVLIAMGAVLGRTSYLQLLVMGLLEVVFFAVNSHIGHHYFETADAGDSIFVHTFGAYFGLGVSFTVNRHKKGMYDEHAMEASSYNSDMFAMIGTLFLWLFWPSFNGGGQDGQELHHAIINTYIALAACTVTSYVVSITVSEDHKFDMVHIQNSTLAGGVAVGASANMMLQPYGAMAVGIVAGILSVLGYRYITPKIDSVLKVHDTCGVHNLHGMPGVLAAIISAGMAAMATTELYPDEHMEAVFPAIAKHNRTPISQAGYQLAALGVTLAISIVSGMITGTILRALPCGIEKENMYVDDPFWIIHPEHHGEGDHKTATSITLHTNDHEMRSSAISASTGDNIKTNRSGGIDNPDFSVTSDTDGA